MTAGREEGRRDRACKGYCRLQFRTVDRSHHAVVDRSAGGDSISMRSGFGGLMDCSDYEELSSGG